MAPSRLIGAKRPPAFRAGARMAKSVSEPPMARASRMRMKKPRSGSVAKACTEVSTPERTMKVPMSDSEKVRMASRMVHTFSALRFRSEEHTSELQSLMRISYAVFCLKKKNKTQILKQHERKNIAPRIY